MPQILIPTTLSAGEYTPASGMTGDVHGVKTYVAASWSTHREKKLITKSAKSLQPLGINNKGVVLGNADIDGKVDRIFLCDSKGIHLLNLPEKFRAVAINNNDEILLTRRVDDVTSSYIWANNKLSQIAPTEKDSVIATAMNDRR